MRNRFQIARTPKQTAECSGCGAFNGHTADCLTMSFMTNRLPREMERRQREEDAFLSHDNRMREIAAQDAIVASLFANRRRR